MLLMFFKFLDAIGVKDPRVSRREAQIANAYWLLGFWSLAARVYPKSWEAYREAVAWDPPEMFGKAWGEHGAVVLDELPCAKVHPTVENVTNGVHAPTVKGFHHPFGRSY